MDLDAGKEKGKQHNRGGNGGGDTAVTKGEMCHVWKNVRKAQARPRRTPRS
jgi:hypothetical protein